MQKNEPKTETAVNRDRTENRSFLENRTKIIFC